MAQWGNTDDAANSVLWATAQVNKEETAANRNALFGNTTANAYFAGVTVGTYAVDTNEIAAEGGKTAHTGHVIRTTGQGGRAGRVMTEVLVAGGITADAEDVAYPDYALTISAQPADDSANSSASDGTEDATFTSGATSVPAGATITFLWQYTTEAGNTETWATTAAVAGLSGQTTTTLTVDTSTFRGANTDLSNGTLFRMIAQTAGAVNAVSTSAELTVTS